jgi:hypothetical protein
MHNPFISLLLLLGGANRPSDAFDSRRPRR